MQRFLLSISYFGPVSYYSLLSLPGQFILEGHEHYTRQSWRNRCRIMGANGPLDLIVPVVKGHSTRQPLQSVRIDNRIPWQKRHNKTIEAAYSKAPFYEFYIDEFSVFWQNEYHSLFDLDIAITKRIMEVIGISSEIKISDRFYPTGLPDVNDYRNLIHPKSPTPHSMFHPHPYVQVFEDRIPFTPDLSILDLIFCTGPDTLAYLQKCHN